jgi:hypothetical protein
MVPSNWYTAFLLSLKSDGAAAATGGGNVAPSQQQQQQQDDGAQQGVVPPTPSTGGGNGSASGGGNHAASSGVTNRNGAQPFATPGGAGATAFPEEEFNALIGTPGGLNAIYSRVSQTPGMALTHAQRLQLRTKEDDQINQEETAYFLAGRNHWKDL